MSSTGDVSSYSGLSGYEASNSGSSLACTSLRKSLVMRHAPHLELTLKIGQITKHSIIIDSPHEIREKLATFADQFLEEFEKYQPPQNDSVDSEFDPNSQHQQFQHQGDGRTTSTPNIARTLAQRPNFVPIALSGGSDDSQDLFHTPLAPVMLVPDTDLSTPMEDDENTPERRAPLLHPVHRQSSDYRTPLAHLQEVEEEIVSEDSLSQSFSDNIKLNSSSETLACSLDIMRAKKKKTLPHEIQATPEEKLLPAGGIFEGLKFVLTYDIDAELHNSFSKDVTKEQIEAGGGQVLTDLQRGDDPRDTVLISDFSSSTKNYLMALVLGVPCITYIWIESCCRLNVRVDLDLHPDYYLDRGKDVLSKASVPHNPTAGRTPFTDCPNIYLQGSKNFKSLWSDIIRVGGGIPRLALNKQYQPDIVVTDGKRGFSVSLKKVIADYTVPVVSDEWLLQTVIQGELADIDTFADLLTEKCQN